MEGAFGICPWKFNFGSPHVFQKIAALKSFRNSWDVCDGHVV